MYIDACHSGSCKDDIEKWLKEKEGGRVYGKGEDRSSCELKNYFDRESVLHLEVYMSCRGDEVAFDAGEGSGSLWTNHFIAKGDMYPEKGHEFKQGDKV